MVERAHDGEYAARMSVSLTPTAAVINTRRAETDGAGCVTGWFFPSETAELSYRIWICDYSPWFHRLVNYEPIKVKDTIVFHSGKYVPAYRVQCCIYTTLLLVITELVHIAFFLEKCLMWNGDILDISPERM